MPAPRSSLPTPPPASLLCSPPSATSVVVLFACSTITIVGTRFTSRLNWVASALSTFVIVFVIVAGFTHADVSNLSPFFPYGVQGTFKAAAVVYWAYTGFDLVATLAEETKDPPRDIPLGLVGSMTVVTILYCVMSLALVMMQKYTELDVNAAYSVAFAIVGMRWAKYIVAVGALKGRTTGLLLGGAGAGPIHHSDCPSTHDSVINVAAWD